MCSFNLSIWLSVSYYHISIVYNANKQIIEESHSLT